MRIFISYGHDEHESYVKDLYAKLIKRGYDACIDVEVLKPGTRDWEIKLENTLKWVSEDPDGKGCMVLVMTPYSVGRPNGYCLNELAYALDLKLALLPIMLVWVKPPLSIYRYQWLDLRGRYTNYPISECFMPIINAIEKKEWLDGDVFIDLKNTLNPIDYIGEIRYYQKDFYGRKWLFNEIDKWLDKDNETADKIFLLVGPPGIGKTSVVVKLIQESDDLIAFHLFRRGNSEMSSAQRAICSIAYQISTQLPEYAQYLYNNSRLLEGLQYKSDNTLFKELIVSPLNACKAPNNTKIILIDALDESNYDENDSLAFWLFDLIDLLPSWIRILITCRQNDEIINGLQRFTPHCILAETKDNLNDISEYVNNRLLEHLGNQPPEEVDVVRKSEGIFLYAKCLLDEYFCEVKDDIKDNFIPRDIGSFYYNSFKRFFKEDFNQYTKVIRPILEVLSAQISPFTINNLVDCLTKCDYTIDADVLRYELNESVHSYFTIDEDDIIRPFHSSIFDWLTSKKAGKYRIDRKNGEKYIAKWLYRLFEASNWNFFIDGEEGDLLMTWFPAILSKRPPLSELDAEIVIYNYLQQVYDKTIIEDLVRYPRRFHFIKGLLNFCFYKSPNNDEIIISISEKVLTDRMCSPKDISLKFKNHVKGLQFMLEKIRTGHINFVISGDDNFYNFQRIQIPLLYVEQSSNLEGVYRTLVDGLLSSVKDNTKIQFANWILQEIQKLVNVIPDSASIAYDFLTVVAQQLDNSFDEFWAQRVSNAADIIRKKMNQNTE